MKAIKTLGILLMLFLGFSGQAQKQRIFSENTGYDLGWRNSAFYILRFDDNNYYIISYKGLFHYDVDAQKTTQVTTDTIPAPINPHREVNPLIRYQNELWFRSDTIWWKLGSDSISRLDDFFQQMLSSRKTFTQGSKSTLWFKSADTLYKYQNDVLTTFHSPYDLNDFYFKGNDEYVYFTETRGVGGRKLVFDGSSIYPISLPDSIYLRFDDHPAVVDSNNALWFRFRALYQYHPSNGLKRIPDGINSHSFLPNGFTTWRQNILSASGQAIVNDTLKPFADLQYYRDEQYQEQGYKSPLVFGNTNVILEIHGPEADTKRAAQLTNGVLSGGVSANGTLFQNDLFFGESFIKPPEPLDLRWVAHPKATLSTTAGLWLAKETRVLNDSTRFRTVRNGIGYAYGRRAYYGYSNILPGDFVAGPLGEKRDSIYTKKYDRVWKITKAQIKAHQKDWSQPGYVMPEVIANWPAHGKVQNGEYGFLAPFVDYNANSLYEPQKGDHPYLKGEEMVYFIFNGYHGPQATKMTSGKTDSLKLEIHGMLYHTGKQNSVLDSAFFVEYKVINRGLTAVTDLLNALEGELNAGAKAPFDYQACDSALQVAYSYTADSSSILASAPKYASFITPLNQLMSSHLTLNYQLQTLHADWDPAFRPQNDFEYFALFNQEAFGLRSYYELKIESKTNLNVIGDGWSSNADLPDTRYQYNDQYNWYQAKRSAFNRLDHRSLVVNEPYNLAPGASMCLAYAFHGATSEDSSFAAIKQGKKQTAQLRAYYQSQLADCWQQVYLGNRLESPSPSLEIYPNPARNMLNLALADGEKLIQTTVYDLSGKKVLNFRLERKLNVGSLSPGLYFLDCETTKKRYLKKWVKL